MHRIHMKFSVYILIHLDNKHIFNTIQLIYGGTTSPVTTLVNESDFTIGIEMDTDLELGSIKACNKAFL